MELSELQASKTPVFMRLGQSPHFDMVLIEEVRSEHVLMRIADRYVQSNGSPIFYRATLMNKCHIKEIRTIEFH